jgi:uncharacterized membrane protein HdeD (DUF308 family)
MPEIHLRRGPGAGPNTAVLFVPGALSCATGALILWLPQLLAYLVAAALLAVGAALLGVAWQIHRSRTSGRGRAWLDRFRWPRD